MLKTVEGVYRNGTIELLERPAEIEDETRVIVTFLTPTLLDLPALGIDTAQAADLRARLSAFAEDWDRPEMDVYDDYETAKTQL